jgi:hypothetical protein
VTGDFTAISVFDMPLQQQTALDRFNQIDFDLQLDQLQRALQAPVTSGDAATTRVCRCRG